MKNLALAVILMASISAQAQGFFKKPATAETPAAAASKPQAAPTVAPPAPVQAAAPAPAVEAPPKPKPVERPKVQRAAASKPAPQAASEAPPQVVERPVQQPRAATPPQPAPAAQNAAAKGMVDPVAECAGGWGIKQAFCRSVQCQRAESFHHPVCVEMRAEQANRPPNLGGGG